MFCFVYLIHRVADFLLHVGCEFIFPVLESKCFGAGDISRQLGSGRGQGVQGDWDARSVERKWSEGPEIYFRFR